MNYINEIYLGTVCLEKNRWSSRLPSIKISDYLAKIYDAGFDGIELWENHALMADEKELNKLIDSPCKMKILNTYCSLGSDNLEASKKSLEMAKKLNVEGIKFNFSRDFDNIRKCVDDTDNWLSKFPSNMRFLCEFHRGYNISYDNIFEARKYVDSMNTSIEGICHAFNDDPNKIYTKFAHFKDEITHIHVQYLRNRQIDTANNLKILRKLGFKGSFTIEFTYGVSDIYEDTDYILDNAIRDLKELRYYLENE